MKGITEIGGVVTPNGVYTAYVAKQLQEGNLAMLSKQGVYFLESFSKDRIVADVLGFVSLEIAEHVTGGSRRRRDWPDGLWFGKRQIHVELVKSGTEPAEFFFDDDESTLLVLDVGALAKYGAFTEARRKALIIRLFKAGLSAYQDWEAAALKRQFRREQATYSKPFVASADAADPATKKPRRKRSVRPGELLPPAERDAMLSQGNDVLRDMLANMPKGNEAAPSPPNKTLNSESVES